MERQPQLKQRKKYKYIFLLSILPILGPITILRMVVKDKITMLPAAMVFISFTDLICDES